MEHAGQGRLQGIQCKRDGQLLEQQGTVGVVIKQIKQLLRKQIADHTAAQTDQKAAADDHRKEAACMIVIASGIGIGEGWQ